MPVEENFDCRRKIVQVHNSLDIPCQLKLKLKWLDQTARRVEVELYHKIVNI